MPSYKIRKDLHSPPRPSPVHAPETKKEVELDKDKSKEKVDEGRKSYDLIKHLDSVPVTVSILELIKSSPQYRAMLYEDLEKAKVPRDSSPEVVRGALASFYRRLEGSARDIDCNEPLCPRSPSQKKICYMCHFFLGMIHYSSKCSSMIILSLMS